MNLFDFFKERGYEPRLDGTSIKIKCPYHEEDTPSCAIKHGSNFYKCFGCGATGTVDSLLSDLGITKVYMTDMLQVARNNILNKISDRLSEFTVIPLKATKIKQTIRSILPETFDAFNVYTLENKESLYFPIKFRGKNMGIIEKPLNGKYINHFVNGYIPFNIDRVSSANIILVEGVFDALSVYQAGYKNVIASLSASYSFSLIKWLNKINARNVQILYDGDEAGRKGAKQLNLKYLDSTIINMPDGKDPNELSNLKEYLEAQEVKK